MAAKKRKRSALKRIRQTQRRTTIKTFGRSAARTAVKTAREALAKGGEAAADAIAAAASALDRAAKRGAIHKNSARRRRGRLAKAAPKGTTQTAERPRRLPRPPSLGGLAAPPPRAAFPRLPARAAAAGLWQVGKEPPAPLREQAWSGQREPVGRDERVAEREGTQELDLRLLAEPA